MHGKEMYTKGNQAHIRAMQEMQKRIQSPDAIQARMEEKKVFETLPGR